MEANLDDVAQGAGVAKGTLYRYFENKAELYVAVLSHNAEVFLELVREALGGGASASDRIRSLGRFYRVHWTENPEYFQIFWALENQPVIGELPRQAVEEITQLWRSCLSELADVINDGVKREEFAPCEPWMMAHLLWSGANALIRSEEVKARRELRRHDLAECFDAMVELYLRGLRNDT